MDDLEITLNREKLGKAIREKRAQESQQQENHENQEKRLSLRDLKTKTGVSASTLSRIENCGTGSPEPEHLIALCCWLRKPPESFFDGVPGSLRVSMHYTTYVNAGLPAPGSDEFEYKDLCEELIPDQDGFFTVTVSGESMIDEKIYHGDLLIVRISKTAVSGDIVVAGINDEYCVKRYEEKKDQVILRSANMNKKLFPDIEVKDTDKFDIFGVVTHSLHRQKGAGPAMR